MPHRQMRGEDVSRAVARAEQHAQRAAQAVDGAREEAHRLREQDRLRKEQLGAALASRDAAWAKLDQVRDLHEELGSKCRCGLAAQHCRTLAVLRGRGMPPRNWHRESRDPDELSD
jgi:hypothetical protein